MLNILFVCVENSCRSQMAEGWVNLNFAGFVTAFSAGSRPSGKVNDRAIAIMKEWGIDISTQRSKGLADLPNLEWDYIVTMGCGDDCPSLPARHRCDWSIPDPKDLDDDGFRAVRGRIAVDAQMLIVDALLEEGGTDITIIDPP